MHNVHVFFEGFATRVADLDPDLYSLVRILKIFTGSGSYPGVVMMQKQVQKNIDLKIFR